MNDYICPNCCKGWDEPGECRFCGEEVIDRLEYEESMRKNMRDEELEDRRLFRNIK